MDRQKVDAIIIGSGQGGVPLATDLSREGQKVVMFERGTWGGSCINYGCTPSKMLLAAAHAAAEARRAKALGIHAEVTVDFPAVMKRIRDTVVSWSQGVRKRLEDAGVHLVESEAEFTGERIVAGGGEVFEAPLVVIDTGKSPFIPPISGIEDISYLTYKNFWQLKELPPRIIIVGGGYVGIELGQAMARLGSQVHIVEMMGSPISREEADVSRIVGGSLYNDGVEFHLNAQAQQIKQDGELFEVSLADRGTLEGEEVLIAVGRKPNAGALRPEVGGIELEEDGHIRVDEQFRTAAEGVYAIGDVTGQPAFTHVSWEDYRRLRSILKGGARKQMDRVLGYAFFTQPQVGRAGLTLEQAQKQGYDARSVTLELEKVARATEIGQSDGFYRIVVDNASDHVLGATLVGPCAAELVHIFIAHMEAGSTWQTLEQSVYIHPTFAEGLPSLARLLK